MNTTEAAVRYISARTSGLLGIGACVLFWAAMLVLGARRPAYSHSLNAISELGARGTPNAVFWNVFGFIVPGLLLAAAGRAIVESIGTSRTGPTRFGGWLLPIFGVTVAAQGLIPAVMQDGQLVQTSWSTRAHLAVSLISGLAWIGALLLLIGPMTRNSDWRGWRAVNVAAVAAVLVAAVTLGGRLPDGLAQRLVDGIVFAWFVAMCVGLRGRSSRAT